MQAQCLTEPLSIPGNAGQMLDSSLLLEGWWKAGGGSPVKRLPITERESLPSLQRRAFQIH